MRMGSILDEKRKRARVKLNQARRWIECNPDAWSFIQNLAQKDYKSNARLSVQRYVELSRSKDWTPTDGDRYKVNNSFAPAFARILIKEHPEYARHIELRKSELDEVV